MKKTIHLQVKTCCKLPPIQSSKAKNQLTKYFKIILIYGLFLKTIIFSGCSIAGVIIIALNANCTVKINSRCIKGSCEFINGVQFERLTVIDTNSHGMPSEYIVTERFECYNPGVDGVQKYWPNKIYFNKPNGHYKWQSDTVHIRYKLNGQRREIVSIEEKLTHSEKIHGMNSPKYDTCPIGFHKNTWYNVNIYDQRVAKILLYIDENKRFNVYKFNSGLSPL